MKKKILIILALVLVISVLCCTVAVAEELATNSDEIVTDETVEETPDETPAADETVEPSITDKIQEAGSEALSWAYVAVGGASGVASLVVTVAMLIAKRKTNEQIRKLDDQNVDITTLKVGFNEMAETLTKQESAIKEIGEILSKNLAVLLDKSKSSDEKNAALCKTLATLINYSNLPDASKENVLGEMNAALGYTKSEVTTDEEND